MIRLARKHWRLLIRAVTILIIVYSAQIEVSAEAIDSEIKEVVSSHIETLLGIDVLNVPIKLVDEEPFYIGEPYTGYEVVNDNLMPVEGLNYPIYQKDKVVFVLSVVENDDGSFSSSTSFNEVDILNENPDYYNGIIKYNNGEIEFIKDEKKIERHVTKEYLGYYFPSKIQYMNIDEPASIQSAIYSPNGFYVNQSAYKWLNTDYCLVNQRDEHGVKRNLCWAATCGTIIRYLTGNRTLESWVIANAKNIGYDVGAGSYTMLYTLYDYSCTSQYRVKGSYASSLTEVYHNINNQYPIAGGFVHTVLGDSHMITIVGYNSSTLISWNSSTEQIETFAYNGSNTKFRMGGWYKWADSILIPLS